MRHGCACDQCPFCGSKQTLLAFRDTEICWCLECDEQWLRRPCCTADCELDHDFEEED
jgi:hypothetical protein